MTEIGEGVSAGGGSGSDDDLEDNHWLELEYRYHSGAPIYGTFLATDSDGTLWSGRLNDQGGVCLAGLPDGPVDVELLPEENAEDELKKTREEIQQILDRIVEDQREQAAQHEAELAQQSGIRRTFTHVHRFGNGLWNGAVGVVEFVGTSVSKAAEVAHYMLPLNQMQNLLSAGYKSYQDGELTWDEWHESLNSNLKREHHEDIARLLGVEPEDVSQQGLEEAMNKVTEAYDIAAFIADDAESREMLTQFAKDMADAQSSLDWAEFAGAGVFEIVLAALLAVFTGGAGNAAQAASKLRHAAHLRRLGHLFQKLARLLRLKKFNKKIEAPVDQKTTTKTDQPDIIDLKPREPYPYHSEVDSQGSSRQEVLYRRDGRGPDVIFEEGFQPWKPDANVSIEDYVNFNEKSQYVGTSKVPAGASEVNTQTGSPGYLYEIDDPGNGVDVNEVYPGNPFSHEQEVAIPGGIESCHIRGCTPLDGNNNAVGDYIPNPRYLKEK